MKNSDFDRMISHSKPWLIDDDIQAVNAQLVDGNIAAGKKRLSLELAMKEYLQTKYFFTTANGSNAIYIALLALGIGNNDEVILPAYVCRNVLDAVVHAGAKPILSDIGDYWRMTTENVKACITGQTKAIIAVHTLGIYSDIHSFKQFGLPIIEDCCQCFADDISGSKPGKGGNISVYSFNATKCLTTGEGGGISTDDDGIARKLESILLNKSVSNPMSDLQCALGLTQLARYNAGLKRRTEIANIYFNTLPSALITDFSIVKSKSMFFRFLLTSDNVDYVHFQNYMSENGIAVRKGVDAILDMPNAKSDFINAARTLKRTISIPIYPSLSNEEVMHISKTINHYEFI